MSSHPALRIHLAALALITLVTVGSRSGLSSPLAAASAPPPPAVGPADVAIPPAAPGGPRIRLPSCCRGPFATPPPPRYQIRRRRPLPARPPCAARSVRLRRVCARQRTLRRLRCPTWRHRCTIYRLRRPPNLPILRKGGPYLGFSAGYLGLPRAPGAYASLGSQALLGTQYGWNIGPLFSLEVGYLGGLFRPKGPLVSGLEQIALNGVTFEMKVRLLRPRRFTRVIPFLHTGLGVYWLSATHKAESSCGKDKTFLMSQGGGVQVGGGLEFFLSRWAVLSAKVTYRPLFMSPVRGAPGGPPLEPEVASRRIHAVSAELGMTILFMR